MRMKKPPHPGRIVRQECIEPLGLTVTEAAQRLGVTRQALNNVVNEKSGISPEMSIRLSKAFGSSPAVWLGLQMEYDLAEAEKDAGKIKVQRITGPARGDGRLNHGRGLQGPPYPEHTKTASRQPSLDCSRCHKLDRRFS
jgi:addiction module HigA family antidote